uniref:Uncharacterized protein n=1 Tax=Nelumbo nucifera TaxID=4432 RepID=A0A822Y9N9_NELNU|nr:TPA_asm: hypothetical protein HUJ06_029193 [Nelumbo nucifera]
MQLLGCLLSILLQMQFLVTLIPYSAVLGLALLLRVLL